MKSFVQLLEESKNDAVEFVRHQLYDQTYKTVECQQCRNNVQYYQFMMSGICRHCAQKEDEVSLGKFNVKIRQTV